MSGAERHEALLLADAPKLQAILPQGAIVCSEKPVWIVLASDYDAQVVFADLLAADLRAVEAERDTLRAANQRLEGEVKALREALETVSQMCRKEYTNRAIKQEADDALRGNGGDVCEST